MKKERKKTKRVSERDRDREKERGQREREMFGLVWFDLFNGISTPYGLYNAEIGFICKFVIWKKERKKERN